MAFVRLPARGSVGGQQARRGGYVALVVVASDDTDLVLGGQSHIARSQSSQWSSKAFTPLSEVTQSRSVLFREVSILPS